MSCVTRSIVVPVRPPKPQHFILHPHPGEGIERAERFIEQQDLGMIDQRPGERDPLGHAAGKMMRDRRRQKLSKPDQAHEFVHLVALFARGRRGRPVPLRCFGEPSAMEKDSGPGRPGRVLRSAR